jgi:hypothetical protein
LRENGHVVQRTGKWKIPKNLHVTAGGKPKVFVGGRSSTIVLIKLGTLPGTEEQFKLEVSLAEPDALDRILKFVNIAVIGDDNDL